jgi:hydroxypyruvate isomerase
VAVLYDVYHQQISEGDLLDRLTGNLDQVGHVHVADVPGRLEPGTGEIAYERVFDALDDAGYDGYVGLEFVETSDGTSMAEAVDATLALD